MICSHCLPHFRHSILGADSVFTNFLLRLFGIDVDFDDEKETETKEKDIDEAEQYRLDNISITIRDYAKTIAKLTAVRGFSMEDVDLVFHLFNPGEPEKGISENEWRLVLGSMGKIMINELHIPFHDLNDTNASEVVKIEASTVEFERRTMMLFEMLDRDGDG
eukprot:TRINITY_DN4345_c0_g2_i4.p1 TRINITY_DN4345_c0_g2~~TRINITY_DN4345_c0_g2_i4.p1  ORF type:complete len:163 (-),score=38.68 TRINITY_DN4345_c0_g2_i4:24-512(-)